MAKRSECRFCALPVYVAGQCEQHYTASVAAKFWPQVEGRHDPDACWLWQGPVQATGYGVSYFGLPKGKITGAHRVAWRLTHGELPAEGLTLDHLCNVKRCVNPAHLEPCTSMENIRRAWVRMPEQPVPASARVARRSYGSGSVHERAPGSWQLRWYTGPDPITGVRTRQSITIRGTRRDALRALAARTSGPLTATAQMPLRTVIELWREQAGHELGTARNYDLAARTLSDHILDTPIVAIRPATLTELYRRIATEHGVHRTRQVHALLSGALTHAWRMEWIPSNPARKVKPPAQPRRAPALTETADVAKLLDAAAGDPLLHAWLLVSAATGARRGEVLALRWSHVDLERGQVVIDGAIDPIDGHVKDTKTTGGRRVVAIGPLATEALHRWRLGFVERALAVTGTVVSDPFVFTDEFDGSAPWRPDGATSRFATIRRRAGVEGVRLHDLRHHVATVLLAAGVEAKTVAARLGHTRVATTVDLYGHAMPARDQVAADLIEQALGG